MYDFESKFEDGQKYEAELDHFFSKWYDIRPVGRELQRLGIDRIFTAKDTGERYSVEYKSDEKTFHTGNVFVETVSVDTQNKLGWALTSCAQLIVYFVPQLRKVYITQTVKIKRKVREWKAVYKILPVPNRTYKTLGMAIPKDEFAKICKVVDFK